MQIKKFKTIHYTASFRRGQRYPGGGGRGGAGAGRGRGGAGAPVGSDLLF